MANPDSELFKTVYFVPYRNHARSVACSPSNVDQFVIGEANGRLSIHSIRNREAIWSIGLPQQADGSIVTACSYTGDGRKIVCTMRNQKLCVVDVESCKLIKTYDNCAYKTQLKCGLAVDFSRDHLLASTDLGGRGIMFYDWRQALPTGHTPKFHLTWIPDMEFVPDGWPWSRYCNCLVTVCTDGQMKVISVDGKLLDIVDAGYIVHCCALTPEKFKGLGRDFTSFATIGGECVSTVLPDLGLDRKISLPELATALRIRFSSSGSRAFVACDDGALRIYQRLSQTLQEQQRLMLHQRDISDLAVSASDEHVVTTSYDGQVYVTKVGSPNHGATEWFEIA